MSDEVRALLVRRLVEDLVGPAAPDEVLSDRPSDRYLTGMLHPRRLEFGADENDALSRGTGGDAEEDEADEELSPTALFKPSAAGVSFCVAAEASNSIPLVIRVRGGTYGIERVAVETHPGDGDEATSASGRRQRARTQWRRLEHDCTVHVDLANGGRPELPLAPHGLVGYSLYLTQAPIEGGRLVTVRLVNDQEWRPDNGGRKPDELTLFQAQLEVRTVAPFRFIPRPASGRAHDADARAAALLYRRRHEYAVGHTCAATWSEEGAHGIEWVATTWLPEQVVRMVTPAGAPALQSAVGAAKHATGLDPLAAEALSGDDAPLEALLSAVPDGYTAWLAEQERVAATLAPDLAAQARLHLAACTAALVRMRNGVARILSDADVRAAFRLMSRAMQVQRRWTEQVRARRESRTFDPATAGLRWHPFQLAFVLQNIESIADPNSSDRDIMDLLWFPTGGGKTEAYLGLIAFTAFLRRIRRRNEPDRGAGVSCIMRYTLRLLTLQQFQRAATLMLACEYVRRGSEVPAGTPDLSIAAPFSVGLWVGSGATPNDLAEAVAALGQTNPKATPKQLTSCPCCGSDLNWEYAGTTIAVTCRGGTACELQRVVPEFPVLTVDELLYREPPTLLFATIDKFAQIVRKPDTEAFFGARRGMMPPDLIIQDELHLISGPLGTLAAIYEAAIDIICTRNGVRPKIIGSTATIRRAEEQIRPLFNRQAAQFPPPGLDIDDSCFAYVEENATSRRYVGVTTAGRSAKFTLQAVAGSLLQSAAAVEDPARRDGYHTLVGYFNSLRELGGALVLARDDVPAGMRTLAARRAETLREPREVVELTSRVSQQEIRGILDQLEVPFGKAGAVDVLLATNMISVGVDVPRLALMMVLGQPKTMSEYIQATSRVGRDRRAPGLVVTILNANKARDRAHFESFTGVHQALYRGVEATSVTPFAARARDRALHAAVVAVARHGVDAFRDAPGADPTGNAELVGLVEALRERAASIDGAEAAATADDLRNILELWALRAPGIAEYWNDYRESESLLVAAERAAARNRSGIGGANPWPTLNSMRTVEAATPFRLAEGLADARP